MLLGESNNQVRRGQLDPRVANALGYLPSILPGALQQGLLECGAELVEVAAYCLNFLNKAGPLSTSGTFDFRYQG